MATDAEVKVYPSHELTAQDFAILIESLTPEADGRIRGCKIHAATNSTEVGITSGWCVLHGRLVHVKSDSTCTVPKPSEGTVVRNIVLVLNLSNGKVIMQAKDGVPEDTPNFNTSSADEPKAYLDLGEVTIGASGIKSVSPAPIMLPHDNLIYRKNIFKKDMYGSKDTFYLIQLYRNGYVVTCNFIYHGVIPAKYVNEYHPLGVIIPEGFRPIEGHGEYAIRIPYMQVSTHNVNGGRGQWLIYANGKVRGESNFSGYIERNGSASWITNDPYPGKVYEDLDET